MNTLYTHAKENTEPEPETEPETKPGAEPESVSVYISFKKILSMNSHHREILCPSFSRLVYLI